MTGLGENAAIAALIVLAGSVATIVLVRGAAILTRVRIGLEALASGEPVRPTLSRAWGPIGLLARTFDATAARIDAERNELGRDNQRLLAVLSGMAEAVLAVDVRRRLLFANASADRLFGLGPGSVGRLIAELIRSPRVQEAVEASLSGPGPFRGEIALAGRDTRSANPDRVLEVLGTALPGDPPAGAVLVFHDVTDLRRLERMRQDFVANVSHELKTPLASIKAYTETLLDWALTDEAVNVRFLRQIEEQADRLNRLILDLLSLASLESGEGVFDHGPLELGPVVRTMGEAHRDRAEAKGLDFLLDLDALHPRVRVRADEEAIRQVLDNLIDNAIKYTPEGGRVRIACALLPEEIALEVADSGIGIPWADQPRVFERFYRVDKARSRELGGTGLGLAIVKHLVQSIGGRIEVASRVGAGSTFTVRLPRIRDRVDRIET